MLVSQILKSKPEGNVITIAPGASVAEAVALLSSKKIGAVIVSSDGKHAAGILSGSLYHHFDSKEAIVDELLRDFLEDLFGRYREIATSQLSAAELA